MILDTSDERSVLTAATSSIVGLAGEWGACIVLEPLPHVLLTTGDAPATTRTVDLVAYPEVTAALASGDVTSRAVAPTSSLGAITVVPLLAGERRLGAIIVGSERRGPLTQFERDALATIGRLAGVVVASQRKPQGRSPHGSVERNPTPIAGVAALNGETATRILVVEDDVDHARALELALSDEGYDVVVASRGEEAVARAKENPPALVLLDVGLPGLDGFAVASELAAHRRTASVPIVFVSGADDLPARVRGCRGGELDFLQKPYRVAELLARINRCLQDAAVVRRLDRQAHIDDLTGLGNLRLFEERLAVEASRVERYRTPLAIAFADVDGLKGINDRYGHPAGSAVLRAIGEALNREIRDTDVTARYGGDEFGVLLPHTQLADGAAFCERVLERISHLHPCGLTLSVSLGVACYDPKLDASVRALLERADRAAYRAKRLGGNRVCTDPPAIACQPTMATATGLPSSHWHDS